MKVGREEGKKRGHQRRGVRPETPWETQATFLTVIVSGISGAGIGLSTDGVQVARPSPARPMPRLQPHSVPY
ncbi:hypothetical protein Pcinc_019799 [Petrolisthes cinctipes]|uniref:Uncharacterized protein n=1 Tax=Petrolisthes cinctipes TaxID=88211 RepID=A0AAE1FJI4_PETCI|nr:hypothetical protein Pcinc_019799 [Petrolisthes cinctipes]